MRAFPIRDILYLTILIFLPTQFGKHFWPPFSYVTGIRVDYLSPTVYVTDILLIALFIYVCFGFCKKKKIISRISASCSSFLCKPIFLTGTAVLVAGAISSQNPLLSLYGIFRILELVFFAYCTKTFLEKSSTKISWALSAILITILFESCLAIAQFLTQQSLGGVLYFLGERRVAADAPGVALAALNGKLVLRPYATFSHPNVLAGFLLVSGSIIGSIFFLQKKTNQLNKKFVYLVLFVAVVAIVFTLSRITIFILGCLLIFLCLLIIKQKTSQQHSFSVRSKSIKRDFLPSILMLIATIIFFIFMSPILIERFLSPDFFGESYRERFVLATMAIEMTLDHPFYGVGLGQFIPSLPHYLSSVRFSLLQPVHSIFLLILAETGVLGFFVVVVTVFRGIKKQLREGSPLIIFPVVLCIILGIGDHYLMTQQQGRLVLGLVLGFLFVDTKIFARRLMKNTKRD